MTYIKNKWNNEQLIEAVKTSTNISDTIRKLGLSTLGSNYKTVKNRIKILNIDTSHFHYDRKTQLTAARKCIHTRTLDELFTENGLYTDTKLLKKRIIKDNLLPYKCYECEISWWRGKKLSLHLDHVNGINTDNRLDNLRFLCPNCHSLTETYCGKNKKNKSIKIQKFCSCGAKIFKSSIHCRKCQAKSQTPKISWPPIDDVIKMADEQGFVQAGKILLVSDNSVRKYLRRNGIDPKTLLPIT